MLRRFRYGESSLVVHLLTPTHGKISVLAKGAYRAKSGYCGVLDYFDTLELTWRHSLGSDLGTLSSGAVRRCRKRVSMDLQRYRAGLAILELAGLGSREQHEESELFKHTTGALDALEGCMAEPALVCSVFDLKFLELQGLTPALDHCALCGESELSDNTGRVPFSARHGGRLCANCARIDPSPNRRPGAGSARGVESRIEHFSPSTLRVARSLLATPFEQLARINLESARTTELMGFVRRFLEYHLEARPRTALPRPGPKLRSSIRTT